MVPERKLNQKYYDKWRGRREKLSLSRWRGKQKKLRFRHSQKHIKNCPKIIFYKLFQLSQLINPKKNLVAQQSARRDHNSAKKSQLPYLQNGGLCQRLGEHLKNVKQPGLRLLRPKHQQHQSGLNNGRLLL